MIPLGTGVSEMATAAHLMRRHCDVEFHDLETGGGFDFLANRAGATLEVECKMVSGDLGRQIHRKRVLELQERLQRVVTLRSGELAPDGLMTWAASSCLIDVTADAIATLGKAAAKAGWTFETSQASSGSARKDSNQEALADLCHALINSNEFFYLQ